MIKIVFDGICKDCPVCDLFLTSQNGEEGYDIHCVHEDACERIENTLKDEYDYSNW